MVARQNIDSLEQMAEYLRDGINNRRRTLDETGPAAPRSEVHAAELRGEIGAFEKVLQILNNQFNIP